MYIKDKKERMERALYNWLNQVNKIEDDIITLIDKNNISKSQISKDVGEMKNGLKTLINNIRNY